MEIMIFLDEDTWIGKFQKLSKDKKKQYIRLALVICESASAFEKKGLISKTTNHRIHWILGIFNNNNNFLPPSKFKELLGIQNINLRFFSNAMSKFWNLLKSEENMRVFREHLKTMEEIANYD